MRAFGIKFRKGPCSLKTKQISHFQHLMCSNKNRNTCARSSSMQLNQVPIGGKTTNFQRIREGWCSLIHLAAFKATISYTVFALFSLCHTILSRFKTGNSRGTKMSFFCANIHNLQSIVFQRKEWFVSNMFSVFSQVGSVALYTLSRKWI